MLHRREDKGPKRKRNEAKGRHKRGCSENAETILVKKMSALIKSETFNILYNRSKIHIFLNTSPPNDSEAQSCLQGT